MRIIPATVLVVIMVGAVTAQPESSGTKGIGAGSCAEFAQHYREAPQHWEMIYFAWAQGFMSGMNLVQLAIKKPERDLNAWPTSRLLRHLREFCNRKPLAVYAEAVADLFLTLPNIPSQSN